LKKKILQINTVINFGSTGRISEEIGLLAIQNGWDSYIAFGRYDRFSDSNKFRIGNDLDIIWHGIETRLFDRHGFSSVNATKQLIEKIKTINPALIHLHNLHGYYLNIEILFNYLSTVSIPVVWTFHDCWPITGHCSHFMFVNCNKWKTECYECPQKTRYPASYFIDRSKKNYVLKKELFNSLSNLTLVPVSEWLSSVLKESFLHKYPIKVINNGINTEVFKPSEKFDFRLKYSLDNKFILLGVASIWDERKGLKDFIELSKLLNSDYQIVLVGLTNKQIKQLPENILGVERTESVEGLADIYASSDVFINPTYEDNFPTTNLESLACGTPVITYKTGGSPEAIDDSTGIIVEQGNINKLVDAVNQIKSHGKQNYSDACVDRAHRLYRKEDRYKEYIDLYESLLR
jgi:putative colanic acid biosynthesis glycosyltransferase